MNDTSMLDKRSQDLEVFYHDAGQFYWGKASSLATVNSIWAGTTIAYEVSPLKAQDIDNISDWNMAELKYRMLNFPKEN
jgi:N-acylneuraminate cytidylyltransferase